MIWLMKTKGQDEKSLRIFEEKKQKEKSQNREEIVQIIHTIYLDFMQEKNYTTNHGLRTPNEGINQRNLKNRADEADKICCRHT